ncbi:MAG: 4-(cytidine 5'-diphospho)-2-C-methyl-D-erythritol kinase [Gammaproteobacteria bacterium]
MAEVDISDPGWLNKWPAPAKINLMLKIVGRREDGYHLLQTVFQMTDLCDWLTFHSLDEGGVRLKHPLPGVPEEEDLTVRAAKLLKIESGYRGGVVIEIEKNLPMGGGLGGGSSDAATTLAVLNRLWKLNFSVEDLMKLGLSLGADVPIFIFGHSAWAEGVGEVLERMILPEPWVVIIKPQCHVETKAVFCAKDLTRDSKPITIRDFLSGQQQNDCLGVVRKLYPPVADALSELSAFGEARLTGTGACVFALFDSEKTAKSAYKVLREKWEVYLARGLNQSPLKTLLDGN